MVVIVVHGGAGNSAENSFEDRFKGVILAAKKGYQTLIKTDQSSDNLALDAVVESAISMENNGIFNAGYGSSLTVEGTVENDAFVMEGKHMQVGAVASVKRFKNPVTVARLVMEKSDHCILSGEGAHNFAEKNGVALIENKELIHQNALTRLANCKTFSETIKNAMNNSESFLSKNNENNLFENKLLIENEMNKMTKLEQMKDHDTVGAVAMDRFGNLACATTTGGLTAKSIGRIGDSPLAGAGGWAENGVACISTTGHGEQIMRVGLAKHIAMNLERLHKENDKADAKNKLSDKEIVKKGVDCGLEYMRERVDGYGGVICIDKNGQFSARCTTKNMPWAAIDGKNLYYGMLPDQVIVKELTESDLVV